MCVVPSRPPHAHARCAALQHVPYFPLALLPRQWAYLQWFFWGHDGTWTQLAASGTRSAWPSGCPFHKYCSYCSLACGGKTSASATASVSGMLGAGGSPKVKGSSLGSGGLLNTGRTNGTGITTQGLGDPPSVPNQQ